MSIPVLLEDADNLEEKSIDQLLIPEIIVNIVISEALITTSTIEMHKQMADVVPFL